MTRPRFTGERLHADQPLFAVDLARHRAAYRWVCERLGRGRLLDVGSGSGYGTVELASCGVWVCGVDRVWPDARNRRLGAFFLRARLDALPFLHPSFDVVTSLQVIEHLEDPQAHLWGLARLLRDHGTAVLTTPNRLTSEGVNPFHLREYTAFELASLAGQSFRDVEMLGVRASARLHDYLEARARRIDTLLRLDFLGLHRRLPRSLREWLFSRLAIAVRWSVKRAGQLPTVSWRDFAIGPVDDGCLDLVALCRGPRRSLSRSARSPKDGTEIAEESPESQEGTEPGAPWGPSVLKWG